MTRLFITFATVSLMTLGAAGQEPFPIVGDYQGTATKFFPNRDPESFSARVCVTWSGTVSEGHVDISRNDEGIVYHGDVTLTEGGFSGQDIQVFGGPNAPVAFESAMASFGGGSLTGNFSNGKGATGLQFTVSCVESLPGCVDSLCLGGGEGEGETEFFWATEDGDYGTAENWEPEQVPGSSDTAIFDRSSSYVVALSGGSTRRAELVRGDVLFRPGTLTLTESSMTPGLRSLEVGTSSSDSAELFIEDATLNTVHSAIGRDANANGSMVVGMNAVWNNAGRLSVGLNGMGELFVTDGGMLASAETRIGDEESSFGVARVASSDTFGSAKGNPPPMWSTGNLAVGVKGLGELVIEGGQIESDAAFIGGTFESGANGLGSVTVQGGGFPDPNWDVGEILVGVTNLGIVLIEDEGMVNAQSLTVGGLGNGRVTVRGSGSVLAAIENMVVALGEGTVGEVTIDGALWAALDIGVGLGGEVDGEVPETSGVVTLLNNGRVELIGNLTVNADGAVRGTGTVEVLGDATNDGGAIAPGVGGIQDIAKSGAATDAETKQDASRRLSIDGTLTMTGGRIEATVDGPTEGEFDQLVVTGDAMLTDTTVAITFGDDFVPETGDEFGVVMVEGALTTENMTVEITGTDPDFEFELMEVDGMLMVMTASGAEPGGEGEGEGDGDGNGNNGGCPAAASGHGFAETGFADVLAVLAVGVLLAGGRTAIRERVSSRR